MPESPHDPPGDEAGKLSALFEAAERGAPGERRADALFTALYQQLHRLARRELHRGAGPVTLSATTLLHEAYLELRSRDATFPDRGRFLAYAARAMRGLIVDHVRERRALKRGGQFQFTSFSTTDEQHLEATEPLGALSDAIDALARAEPALAELVELKYFCGFDLAEIAAMRGVNERTTQRHWDKARIYLKQALEQE